MREIKFRMYDKKAKQFTYWGFIQTKYGLEFRLPIMGGGIGINEARELSEQYTGLKDKNGVEIYDGDVVEFTTYSETEPLFDNIYEVIYSEYRGGFLFKESKPKLCYSTLDELSEGAYVIELNIVGNIHDNPELL